MLNIGENGIKATIKQAKGRREVMGYIDGKSQRIFELEAQLAVSRQREAVLREESIQAVLRTNKAAYAEGLAKGRQESDRLREALRREKERNLPSQELI